MFTTLGRALADRSLLAALLLFVGLGVLHALVVPPLEPTDERAHLSYALELQDGNLPSIDTPIRVEILRRSRFPPRNTIWVANHPPLFYAMMAVIVGDVAEANDVPEAVLRARLLSLALASVGLCFVFWIVRELTGPGSCLPQLVVALTVLVPHFTHVMAIMHNDGAAFLASVGTLFFATRLLRRGLSCRRYLGLLFFACVAMSVRLSCTVVVATSLTALAVACFRVAPGSRGRRAAICVSAVLGVLATIGVTSGWFYLRNYELYGEISGVATLFHRFHREPRAGVLELVGNVRFWWHFVEQLWGYYAGAKTLLPTTLTLPLLVGVGALVGLAIQVIEKARLVLRADLGKLLSGPTATVIVMYTGFSCLTLLSIGVFASLGGSPHGRYLIPALWCFAGLAAIGLRRLGRRAVGLGVTVLMLSHLLTLDSYVARAHVLRGEELTDMLLASIDPPGDAEVQTLIVMLIAVAAGLLGILESLRSGGCGDHWFCLGAKSSQSSDVGSSSAEPSTPGTR